MNDNYGRVASSKTVASDTEEELYEVPTGMEFVGLLSICNQNAAAQTYRVALTDASGAATADDWLAYDIPLSANARTTIKVFLDEAQTIRIQSSLLNEISFVLHGLLIDNR